MKPVRKRLIITALCTGMALVLLLALALIAPLLANREMVKTLIVSKTAQLTGGELSYSRLELNYFPLPHLVARDIRLHRTETFDARARELSLYPGIRSSLRARLSIEHLVLVAPEVRVPMPDPRPPRRVRDADVDAPFRALGLQAVFEGLRNLAGVLDPGMAVDVEAGALTLVYADAPDLQVSRIVARVDNIDGELALNLSAASDWWGDLNLDLTVDGRAGRADGSLTLTDLNLARLGYYAFLPWQLDIGETRLTGRIDFSLTESETLQARFDYQAPSVTVMRQDRILDVLGVAASGSLELDNRQWSLAMDRLQARQPALDLVAAATHRRDDSGSIRVDLHAATGQLDIAAVGAAARAIAGDRREVQTAFRVARSGRLTDVTYFSAFDRDPSGWRLIRREAAGRLSQGRVTLPGIDTDLEHLAGKVAHADKRVDFHEFSGTFVAAEVGGLTASIDWSDRPRLRIASSQAAIDAAPLYAWLTDFEGLSRVKTIVDGAAGSAQITHLEIAGPLTRPQDWHVEVSGTPLALRLTSPFVPFAVRLSGGEITYLPGQEQAKDVRLDFLDAALVASHQSAGIVAPAWLSWQIDGILGQAAVDWLSTRLLIPDHLQVKAPVELSGVAVSWEAGPKLAVAGALQTADGVDLDADISRSPQTWQIRRLQFSDGRSQAALSATKTPAVIELAFRGSIDRRTADRLLRDNQTLSGRLEGDFRTRLDLAEPLRSEFWGRLVGHGVHLHALTRIPVQVDRFAVEGHGDRLEVVYCEVERDGNRLSIAGRLDHRDGDLRFDLDLEADSVDPDFIRAFLLQPNQADPNGGTAGVVAWVPQGTIRIKAADFRLGRWIWSPVQAEIAVDGTEAHVTMTRADLCGIATTGQLEVTPGGVGLRLHPKAVGASFQETLDCLVSRPLTVQAQYDLSGEIRLPTTRDDPVQALSGELIFSSRDGRIEHSGLLMKIFSVLNITELFTGGKSDLTREGYGYNLAEVTAVLGNGTLHLVEILLDGHSLKLTGQGQVDLIDQTVDITLLAAPLKTVDRIIDKIPIIGYIAGGSLISVPLKVHGRVDDPLVTPMPPAAVGKGVLNLMERTLRAPFKLFELVTNFLSEEAAREVAPPAEGNHHGP